MNHAEAVITPNACTRLIEILHDIVDSEALMPDEEMPELANIFLDTPCPNLIVDLLRDFFYVNQLLDKVNVEGNDSFEVEIIKRDGEDNFKISIITGEIEAIPIEELVSVFYELKSITPARRIFGHSFPKRDSVFITLNKDLEDMPLELKRILSGYTEATFFYSLQSYSRIETLEISGLRRAQLPKLYTFLHVIMASASNRIRYPKQSWKISFTKTHDWRVWTQRILYDYALVDRTLLAPDRKLRMTKALLTNQPWKNKSGMPLPYGVAEHIISFLGKTMTDQEYARFGNASELQPILRSGWESKAKADNDSLFDTAATAPSAAAYFHKKETDDESPSATKKQRFGGGRHKASRRRSSIRGKQKNLRSKSKFKRR